MSAMDVLALIAGLAILCLMTWVLLNPERF
jgi:hypothetical protein